MSDNGELNQMREPQKPAGGGAGSSNGLIGLIGTVLVLAILIGMWGSEATVSLFGLDLRPTWLILIAYLGGLLAGRFPIRRR